VSAHKGRFPCASYDPTANLYTALQESKNGISFGEARRRLGLLREELEVVP
jgi:hypothetical protein